MLSLYPKILCTLSYIRYIQYLQYVHSSPQSVSLNRCSSGYGSSCLLVGRRFVVVVVAVVVVRVVSSVIFVWLVYGTFKQHNQ